jgi:MFS family permease
VKHIKEVADSDKIDFGQAGQAQAHRADGSKQKPAQSYVVMAFIVVSAGILSSLIQCKVPSILLPLSEQFGMDNTTGSLMMSVFTIMGIFFSIPSSKVIERLGAKKVLINSIFIMLAGSLLGTFSPNATVLIVSRALEGIALISTTIAGATFLQSSVPADRMGTAFGIWSIWFALGSATAGVLSPIIYTNLGFQPLWLIYAAMATAAALAIRFFVKAPNVVFANSYQGVAKPSYRELLNLNVIMILVVFAAYNLLSLAVVTYVPTILQMQGYDASLSGLISTLPMLLSIISAPLLGILSDRLGRVKPLMALSFLFLTLTTPLMFVFIGWQLWAVAIASGLLGCCGASLLMVAYLAVLPRKELVPIALGVFATMQGLGMFLGSFLLSFVLGPELSNWHAAAITLLGIGLVGFVASLVCRYR